MGFEDPIEDGFERTHKRSPDATLDPEGITEGSQCVADHWKTAPICSGTLERVPQNNPYSAFP
jgi:hypothetical protein